MALLASKVYSELSVDSESFFNGIERELQSYPELALFIESKIKEDAVDAMVNEYFHYMNHINSPLKSNTQPKASNSVKLIWKMHLLHPKTYRRDCFKRFGRVISPRSHDLEFDLSVSSPLSTTEAEEVSKFSDLDLKKSVILHYEFIQKILGIKENDVTIREWIDNYKQFMASIGKNAHKTIIIKPTIETDLIWHCHMLFPNIYLKESLILANGTFVNHIVDLQVVKQKGYLIKNENIPKHNMNRRSIMLIITSLILLILAIIASYAYIHTQNDNNPVNPFKIQFFTPKKSYVTTPCSYEDEMFCAYIDGLNAIFTTTDTLQSAKDQSEFESLLTGIIATINTLIFYNAADNVLLTPPGNGYPFGDRDKVAQLIANYGDEICENADVSAVSPPWRLSTMLCRGWIYVSGSGQNIIKETAPLSVDDQKGGYAILMGRMFNFNKDFIYYFYVHPLEYRQGGCTLDTSECGKTKAQMLLGNALFYISVLRYDYVDDMDIVWHTMNDNAYFGTSTESTSGDEYYVFVNEYSNGYSYVHGESDKRNTQTSLNSVLRVGADELFGEWIEYMRTNGDKKRSFIIGPYPNIEYGARTRLYVGSGYVYGNGSGDGKTDDNTVWYILAGIGGIILLVCACAYCGGCGGGGGGYGGGGCGGGGCGGGGG
eukprot:764773_1